MGLILKNNFTMLSLLNELVHCGVLTGEQMDRLKIEFNEAGAVLAILSLEERNSFLEKLDDYIDRGIETCDIVQLQDMHFLKNGNDALVQTWWRIQKYVDINKCPIVAIVHALMAEHIEPYYR